MLDIAEQLGRRKALHEDIVTSFDNGVTNYVRIRMNEIVEAAVDEAKSEDFTRGEVFEHLEEKLCRELSEVDDSVTLLLPRSILPFLPLSALVLQRKSRRLVLERFVVVAYVSWHGVVVFKNVKLRVARSWSKVWRIIADQ